MLYILYCRWDNPGLPDQFFSLQMSDGQDDGQPKNLFATVGSVLIISDRGHAKPG